MPRFLLPCFIFLLSSFIAKAQDEVLTLKTTEGELEGTLSIPDKKKDIPLVLIIAGSGPTDRNGNQGEMENNSLKMIASELSKNNIASFRFDKRGIGQSSDAMKEESELRFETYVNDVNAWIDLLAKDKRFSKIIVAGHSEGSLLGMIASQNNKNVKAFVSIAGAGRPADMLIREQLDKAPDNIKTIVFSMLDKVKNGDTIPNVPTIFYALLRPSIQPYMKSWFKYDPQLEIAKLKIPVLITQGNMDSQVKENDAVLLSKAQTKASLKIIKSMNHVLKTCESMDKEIQKAIYSNPDLPLNPDFVTELIAYVNTIKT